MKYFNWLTGRFSNRGKAMTLYRRGMARVKSQDHEGAIGDYTAMIGMLDTPADMKAMALYNRALAYTATGEEPKAAEDLKLILAMQGALANVKTEARRLLVRMQRRSESRGELAYRSAPTERWKQTRSEPKVDGQRSNS